MKIEKELHRVRIICKDGSLIKGFVHINPGERMTDFLNAKENFIPVTEAKFYNIRKIHSFALFGKIVKKEKTIVLSKASIKLIEED